MDRSRMMQRKMLGSLKGLHGTGVLVVGDLMLDRFIWGKVSRISPEAPVPVVDVQSETYVPGGAANVMTNLHALGAEVHVAGTVGQDREGRILLDLLSENGLNTQGIFPIKGKPTTLKTRIIAHSQQLVRVDREVRESVSASLTTKLLDSIERCLPRVKAIVIADYAKGVVSRDLIEGIVSAASKRHAGAIPVLVDPKTLDFSVYRGVDLIKPNQQEAAQAAHILISSHEDLRLAAERLLRDVECQAVLITRGEEGMSLFEKEHGFTHIPTTARQVYDVTGAGDTVMAVLALCLASGVDLVTAAHLSNHAAGVVVGKVGVSTVSLHELQEAITKDDP
ncbi:MAG TPA: D-glycero-beta-D-manno-heptose-7-phosphate kinase [bacterium]|nr:D-glycero-beta-D-manno-heptose-7-phosphate kinase [bacterium]